MQITRAKATALLNKGEMQLYDDSRHNAVRGFKLSQLEGRITRARSARDRARDLVRRQKLASRDRTGSKRGTSGAANQRTEDKVEILADILKRFETQRKEAAKAEKGAAGKSPAAARKSPGTAKQAVRKADRRSARKAVKKAAKTAAPAKSATKKAGAGTTPRKVVKKATTKTTKKAAGRKAARSGKAAKEPTGPAGASGGKLTPAQALRRTRKVLEARQEEARQPKSWQEPSSHGGQVSADGYQSGAAERRAGDLHAAESRQPAIHGSIGTRGRITQGKRDSHGGGED